MSTLVVVAHPDDEVLGAGGTISRLAAEGERVHIAIVCHTRASGYLKAAIAKLLPPLYDTNVVLLNQPDQALDSVPLTTLICKIEEIIADTKPDTVYTHHPDDLNFDHAITYRAVMTACRPTNGCTVKTIYAMEIPSSTEWGQAHGFHPTTYVDISDTIAAKVAAMEAYESERRTSPHPRSPEMLRALASIRGAAAGLEYAEAFQLIRQIR